MAYIGLSQEKVALVDDDMWDWLNQWKWCANKHKQTFYAQRNEYSKGKCRIIYMHREILNVKKGDLTDHINRNGLDNRKCNLRLCTNSQNSQNRRPYKGKSSIYKGVYYDKQKQKWAAQICRKRIGCLYLGAYFIEIEAAKAYDAKALELFGEFAYTNFKQGEQNVSSNCSSNVIVPIGI